MELDVTAVASPLRSPCPDVFSELEQLAHDHVTDHVIESDTASGDHVTDHVTVSDTPSGDHVIESDSVTGDHVTGTGQASTVSDNVEGSRGSATRSASHSATPPPPSFSPPLPSPSPPSVPASDTVSDTEDQ